MPATDIFSTMKRRNDKIAAVTAYDAPTARFAAEAGADILLVGDSVGVNILGYAHEREVTLADMTHHIAAVRRGAPQAYARQAPINGRWTPLVNEAFASMADVRRALGELPDGDSRADPLRVRLWPIFLHRERTIQRARD